MNSYFTYLGLLFFLTLYCSCNKNIEKKNQLDNVVHLENEKVNITKSKLDSIQGIWVGEKDINQSTSYRVQYGKKILDLICLEGYCNTDNLFVERSLLGFCEANDFEKHRHNIGKTNIIKFIKSDGNLMIKWSDSIFIDQNHNINSVFYVTKLVPNYMLDKEGNKLSSFVKLKSLPKDLFSSISERKENILEDYHILELSSKIKVISNKTYFYDNMSDDTKRKAFLVKNDVAYLEEVTDEWAKIYYDGMTMVTGGYVKLKDVVVLE